MRFLFQRDATFCPSTLSSVCLSDPPDQPEKLVRIMAGTVTLTGLALGFFVSPWGYLVTAFAGVNILQSAFTGFCPPELAYRVFTKMTVSTPDRQRRVSNP